MAMIFLAEELLPAWNGGKKKIFWPASAASCVVLIKGSLGLREDGEGWAQPVGAERKRELSSSSKKRQLGMAGWAFPCGLVFDWAACEEFNRIVLGATLMKGLSRESGGCSVCLGIMGHSSFWACGGEIPAGDPCARGV